MPEIGKPAPDFSVPDQNGNPVSLSQFRGKKIILYFYPKDNTSGCTAEACNLRDNYEELTNEGFVVIGVSTDSQQSHQKFIAKHNLPFILLADSEKVVHGAYETWVEKNMYGRKYMGTARHTFIIDEQGILIAVIKKVETKNHAEQIRKILKSI